MLQMLLELDANHCHYYMTMNNYYLIFEVVARSSCTKHVQTRRLKGTGIEIGRLILSQRSRVDVLSLISHHMSG